MWGKRGAGGGGQGGVGISHKEEVIILRLLVPVVQTLDSTIHRIKVYPMNNAIGFPNTYPLDSDLSGG